MCPVLYSGATRVLKTHSVSTEQAVKNYSLSNGSFVVQTSNTDMASSTNQLYEDYSFRAITPAFSKVMPFKVYF